jgi:hypothetical protein
MRHVLAALSAFFLLLFSSVCMANPDGPPGGLTLEPSFRLGPMASQWDALGVDRTSVRTWHASMALLAPVTNSVTLGFTFTRTQDWREISQAPPPPPGFWVEGRNHVELWNEVEFLARIHLPPRRRSAP